jgi:thymidylate synthase (FAD)
MSDNCVFTTKPKVTLINHHASDEAVLAAMLVSTQGEDSLKFFAADPEAGAGRINFLMKNKHGTPFEHNMFTFYIQAGIFVFREFHRHRIGWSYNEESGRYKQLDPLFYVPARDRPMVQKGKPGAYEFEPDEDLAKLAEKTLVKSYIAAYDAYEAMVEAGIAKEVARMCLPVGINSSMYATCNARSLMSFLSLRTYSPDATFPSRPQYEIEQVAREMESIFAYKMPVTYEAWINNGRVAP